MDAPPEAANHDSPRAELGKLAAAGLLRTLKALDGGSGGRVSRGGTPLVNFASNDYLGLSRHPRVEEAMVEGVREFGAGAAASRLVCGSLPPHHTLEAAIAGAKGTEAALTFSTGHAVAIGCIPAVVGKDDVVILDKLSHACLVDAARLSGATIRVFPHNQTCRLADLLKKSRAAAANRRILVVTESVFSMDGDVCPLREIVELCEAHEAMLWLDEAHAIGVTGPEGLGLAAALGLQQRITFQMGTLGKALGLAGGYLAASRDWIELMVNRARSFVFSTAPPPSLAHAAVAAIDVCRSPEGDALRATLSRHIATIAMAGHPSAIVPVVLGGNSAALEASTRLADAGFLVPAIRFPTVPRGTARLRISLSAAHTDDEVALLAAAMRSAGLPTQQPPTSRHISHPDG